MKKWFYLSVLLLAVVFTSCTKTTNEIIPNKTIIVPGNSGDWKYDGNTKSYYISISVPELDNNTNQTDAVVVSMARNGGSLYEALPEVYNNTSFTFIHQPGTVLIEAQGVNGSTIQLPPNNITFKIVLIPSTQI
ncbi:hypothetical protein [Chitinophaga vietnamensis]|uniref:hypothetical protein n=1 Tax=Chitinophaga vietnamensis TaxID=2593957 RepID=UPI001178268D|nr:hypothetical protein [Chitinophaga vietnamensis]